MPAKKINTQPLVKKPSSQVALLEKTEKEKIVADSKKEQKLSSSSSTCVKTIITIKYDVGFGNHITIRGHGIAGLSWDKGLPLKNISANEWVFETNATFIQAEIKVLINDRQFEIGPNHALRCGACLRYTPKF